MNTKWTASTLKSRISFFATKGEWIHSSVVRKYFKYFTCNKNVKRKPERKPQLQIQIRTTCIYGDTDTATATDADTDTDTHSEGGTQTICIVCCRPLRFVRDFRSTFLFCLLLLCFCPFWPISYGVTGADWGVKPWIEALIELIEIGISVVGKKSGQLQHPLAIMQNKPKKKYGPWLFKQTEAAHWQFELSGLITEGKIKINVCI